MSPYAGPAPASEDSTLFAFAKECAAVWMQHSSLTMALSLAYAFSCFCGLLPMKIWTSYVRECQDFCSDKISKSFGSSEERPEISPVRRLYNQTRKWATISLLLSFPVTLLVGPWILQSPLNALIDTIIIVLLMFLTFLLVFCIFYLLVSLFFGLLARNGSIGLRLRFRDMIPVVVFVTSSVSVVAASLFQARWAWSIIIASIVFLSSVFRMRSGGEFVPRKALIHSGMITFIMWFIMATTHVLSSIKAPEEYEAEGTRHTLVFFQLIHQRLKVWGGWMCTGVWASVPVLLFSACMRIDWTNCRSDSVTDAIAADMAQFTLFDSPKTPRNPFAPLLEFPKPYFWSAFSSWMVSTLAYPVFATTMSVRPEAASDTLINIFITVAVAMPLMSMSLLAVSYCRQEFDKALSIRSWYPADEPEVYSIETDPDGKDALKAIHEAGRPSRAC